VLAVIQFPIGDGRLFSPVAASRLRIPDFPQPRTHTPAQFLRYFGQATRRRRGADAAWVDEASFCMARRALRLPDLPRRRIGSGSGEMVPVGAFRRAFSDGLAVARVEIGLAHSRRADPIWTLGPGGLNAIVRDFMELPSLVDDLSGKGKGARELVNQGWYLARLWERATSVLSGSLLASNGNRGRLVEDGRPLVLVEYDPWEVNALPSEAIHIDPTRTHGAGLAFGWTSTKWGVAIGTWYIKRGDADPRQLRSLRLCLLRLHAEQEALDAILRFLARGEIAFDPETESGPRLTDYLNRATRAISRAQWAGVSQSAILEAFDAAEFVDQPQTQGLAGRLEGVQNQVRKKVEEYDQRRSVKRTVYTNAYYERVEGDIVEGGKVEVSGGTVYGSVIGKVSAGKIEDSFNTFAGSNPSPELAAAMAELRAEVDGLVQAMDKQKVGQPEEVADRFGIIAEQVSKNEPLKDVLKAAGEGLVEAAKAVADRAEPVAKALSKVLKFAGVAAIFI
jgi:hypothetical protein